MGRLWKVLGMCLLLANWGIAGADRDRPEVDFHNPDQNSNPHWQAIKKAADAKDYDGLVRAAARGVAAEPHNADFHNMLAFGLRNRPNPDMALVFKHYNEALRIDPWHVGAHEYLGEA